MTYELPPIGHALSGGVAAALANVVIYPLDMATTRVQSQSTKEPHHSSSSSSERKEILPIEFKRPEPDTPSSSSSSSSSSTSSTATTSDVSLSEDGRKKVTKIIKTTTVTTTTRTLSGATGSKEKIHYTSVADAIRKTYRSEGFLALYSGLGSDTVATLMSNFVYFYIYMALRQYKEHRRKSGQLSTVQELFLGAEAGIISRLFTNPIHVITTRQQVMGKELQQQKEQPGAATAGSKGKAKAEDTTKISARAIIRDIYSQDGILGFWAGYAPTVILSINPSITYFLFETIKKMIVTRQTQALLAKDQSPAKSALAAASALTSLQIFFISACSKAIASFLTYPLILTKTKLQAKSEDDEEEEGGGKEGAKDEEAAIGNNDNNTSTAESQTTKKAKKFTGISDVIRTVVKDKGIAGLYTGCQGQVVKGFFSFGLMYMIKDRVVAWMLTLFLAVHNMRNRVTSS